MDNISSKNTNNSVDKNKTLPPIVFYNISMFFTNLGIHQLCNNDEYKFYKTGIKTCNQESCKHLSAWSNNSIYVYFYWRDHILVRYRVSYCQDIWPGQILICKFLRYEKHNFWQTKQTRKYFCELEAHSKFKNPFCPSKYNTVCREG